MQILLLAEIPFDVVAARGGGPAHLAQTMVLFPTQKTHFRGANVVGQTNHRANVVGRQQVIGDEHRTWDTLIDVFCLDLLEQGI